MQGFEFVSPTKFILEKDADLLCGREVKKYSDKVLFVHYGDAFTIDSGLHGRITGALGGAGVECFELAGVKPNPDAALVRRGVELVKKENIGCILAVGGGSVIDTAKAVGIGAKYDGDVWDFYTKKAAPVSSLPVGVVMTLPATGSEASNGSVLKDNGVSADVMSDVMRPVFALMNPDLTLDIPKKLTCYGIVDMLTHVMERYFSTTNDVDVTDYMAEGLMKSIISNARKLMQDLHDAEIRAELMWASIVAHNGVIGVGRNQDWASHALAAQLSARFNAVHGAALSVLYPRWAEYVLDGSNVTRFAQFANRVFGVEMDYYRPMETAREGIRQLRCFFDFLECPATMADIGIDDSEGLGPLAQRVCAYGSIGCMKRLDAGDVENIYLSAM